MATGITLATGFQVNAQLPADLKINVADIAARDALAGITRFKGMIVTVQDSDGSGTLATYILTAQSGTTINNADWATFGAGGIITADNGLTLTGTNVQLGGTLIQPTVIDLDNTYYFQFAQDHTGILPIDSYITPHQVLFSVGPSGNVTDSVYNAFTIYPDSLVYATQTLSTSVQWLSLQYNDFLLRDASTNTPYFDAQPTQVTIPYLSNIDPSTFVQANSAGILTNVSIGSIGGVTGTGAAGEVTYWTGTSTVSGDGNFLWDPSNQRFGVNIDPMFGGFPVAMALQTNINNLTNGPNFPEFSGTGPDDSTWAGTYTGGILNTIIITVTIASSGTPDTYDLKYGPQGTTTYQAFGIPITAGPMTTAPGITLEFGSTTGHHVGDVFVYVYNQGGDNAFTLWNPRQTDLPTWIISPDGSLSMYNEDSNSNIQINLANGGSPFNSSMNYNGYAVIQTGNGWDGDTALAGFSAASSAGGINIYAGATSNSQYPNLAFFQASSFTEGLFIEANSGPIKFGSLLGTTTYATFDNTTGFFGVGVTTPGNVLEVANNAGLGTGYTGIRVGVNSGTTTLGSTSVVLAVDGNGDIGLYDGASSVLADSGLSFDVPTNPTTIILGGSNLTDNRNVGIPLGFSMAFTDDFASPSFNYLLLQQDSAELGTESADLQILGSVTDGIPTQLIFVDRSAFGTHLLDITTTTIGSSILVNTDPTAFLQADASGNISNVALGSLDVVTGTGVSGQVTYWNGTTTITGSNYHWWDDANMRLGIGNQVPSNTLSVTPLQYATGTASQSGTTITGSGTTFTNAMIGSQFIFADGTDAGTITARGSNTNLTVTNAHTVSSQAFRISYTGLQVVNGNVAVGTVSPDSSATFSVISPNRFLANATIWLGADTTPGGFNARLYTDINSTLHLTSGTNLVQADLYFQAPHAGFGSNASDNAWLTARASQSNVASINIGSGSAITGPITDGDIGYFSSHLWFYNSSYFAQLDMPDQTSNSGKVLSTNGTTASWIAASTGTVTSFTFTDGHGFDGTVTNSTTTPTLSLTTQLTPGSVTFISSPHDLAEDNNALFWDNTNKYFGINTGASPTFNFQVSTSGSTTTSNSQINSYNTVTGTTGANGVIINSKVNTTADMSVQTRGLAVSQNVVANGHNLTNTPGQEGILVTSNLTDSGHVITLSGVVSKATNSGSGTVDYGVGLRLLPNLNTGGGTLTTAVGAEIDDQTHGTNNTNVLIGVPDADTAPTGNFSIYNISAYDNYFASTLGIGTTTPVAALNTVATSAADFRGIVSDEYINAGNSAHFQARKARGTLTSPTTVVTGDGIGSFLSYGYDGTSYLPVGRIDVLATGTVSTGIIPGIMRFRTADATGTLTTAGSFGADQTLTLSSIPALGSPATLFLVSNGGVVSSRTPSQVRSDIGAGTGSGTVTGSSTATYITFWDTSTDISGDSNMIWDNTNKWMGLNTSATGPTNTITMGQGATGYAHYNTTDQVTAYERIVNQWQSSVYTIGSYAGTGATVRSIQIGLQPTLATTTLTNGRNFTISPAVTSGAGIFDFSLNTGGTTNAITTFSGTSSAAAGTATWVGVFPTINQTGSAAYTAFKVAPFQQAVIAASSNLLATFGTSAAAVGQSTYTPRFEFNNTGSMSINGAVDASALLAFGNGSRSVAAWGLAGPIIRVPAITVTDNNTATNATVTNAMFTSFAGPTIATTNTGITYTNTATVYIAGAPNSGTNTPTLTNNYTLLADGGYSGFQRIKSGVNNYSTAVIGLTGNSLAILGNTINDTATAGSGTVAAVATNAIAAPTFTATNTLVTYTSGATLYISGAPTASTNVTITNPFALQVAAGVTALQGGYTTGTSLSVGTFVAAGGQGSNTINTGTSTNLFGGASAVRFHTGATATGTTGAITAASSYTNFLVGSSPITAASTGTHALFANLVVNPTGAITGSATVTATASLYIGGAGSGGTSNYAIWAANGGNIRWDLGSDATGDIYYRNSSGLFTRLAIGSSTNVLTVSGGLPVWAAAGGGTGTVTSITSGTGITLSPGTITTTGSVTSNLSTGVSGGQSVIGGTGAGENLTLVSTSNATKGFIILGASGTSAYDGTKGFLGLGTTTPAALLHLSGAISASAWSNNGIAFRQDAATYTDTNSSGVTGGITSINAIRIPTISTSNAGVTFTNAATFYIEGVPASGTNTPTINSPWAIFVNAGASRFGDVKLGVTGSGLYVAESGNATMGVATLSAGTVVVNTTKVTANSRIFLTGQGGSITNLGSYSVTARSAGTSFTISSSNVLDTNTVAWLIVEPA